jgi:hypothetical protein
MDMKMLNGFAPFLGRTGKGRTPPKPFQALAKSGNPMGLVVIVIA